VAIKFPRSERFNFNKNLVKRHKLATYLDRYLGTEVENFQFTYEPKIEDDAWHPSGHCTPDVTVLYDIAKSVIDGTHEKKKWDVGMLKTFLVGHFWHQLLQKAVVDLELAKPEAIERRGLKVWGFDPDLEPTAFHWATGQGDVAPCSLPGAGDYVVDFKTMSAHQFKTSGIPDWAAHKYEAQINVYMDFFDLDSGLILAICKDTPHEFKEFEFERNQSLIDGIYDKWQFVSECLAAGEAPSELDNDAFSLESYYRGPVAQ
jgi:hypothetical protein